MEPYMFKHKKKGLGIHNWIKSKTAIKPGEKGISQAIVFFKAVIAGGRLTHYPVLSYLYEKAMFLRPSRKKFTSGVALNLNVDIAENSKNTAMPIELIKKAVSETAYIAIMHRCFCRSAQNCSDHPQDLGCIFIGEGSRAVVEKGIARKATVEEAMEHIDRAVKSGLVGQSLWIEAEQYLWGIKDEDMHRFLEVCFCCPCCCTALKLAKNSRDDLRDRFRSIGWKAVVDENSPKECGRCQVCTTACPLEAVSNTNGRAEIREDRCMGCGICAVQCPNDKIRLHVMTPPKGDLKDYFWQLDLDL
ncbi:4Fe-4S binding domain-containing protein [Desulfatibacillum alkenivorans DSM 16219]|jgi:Pyruvate/2-oxoacid:ferredoxin oxidoreductase delta subunit|uniref:4Fe-4S binding domain-containing protein n=1 Tax=Desulfatibacillum alkenivorans DSM 16219 TaxID=1121393 RepID=A0A1M6TEA5_9BACT|nr:4Fe-4S binding protein [Desulfatibacillum alkenivorans]SHK55327.1 4Fe-4S binding domain-containing protein [Desulfatibacillum alkenivorans DSM 16219]